MKEVGFMGYSGNYKSQLLAAVARELANNGKVGIVELNPINPCLDDLLAISSDLGVADYIGMAIPEYRFHMVPDADLFRVGESGNIVFLPFYGTGARSFIKEHPDFVAQVVDQRYFSPKSISEEVEQRSSGGSVSESIFLIDQAFGKMFDQQAGATEYILLDAPHGYMLLAAFVGRGVIDCEKRLTVVCADPTSTSDRQYVEFLKQTVLKPASHITDEQEMTTESQHFALFVSIDQPISTVARDICRFIK